MILPEGVLTFTWTEGFLLFSLSMTFLDSLQVFAKDFDISCFPELSLVFHFEFLEKRPKVLQELYHREMSRDPGKLCLHILLNVQVLIELEAEWIAVLIGVSDHSFCGASVIPVLLIFINSEEGSLFTFDSFRQPHPRLGKSHRSADQIIKSTLVNKLPCEMYCYTHRSKLEPQTRNCPNTPSATT